MTIAIVTAGDYVFAASTCVKLHQKGIVVKIIDVDGNVKNKIRKHLKLSILFGPFNILKL